VTFPLPFVRSRSCSADYFKSPWTIDQFYTALSPSSTLLARLYFNHLRVNSNPLLSELEPVITLLAFQISTRWTTLLALLENEEERDEKLEREMERIIRDLVGIAAGGDYGDEVGRRSMFKLIRASLLCSSPHVALVFHHELRVTDAT
jgi:hypothetical protein